LSNRSRYAVTNLFERTRERERKRQREGERKERDRKREKEMESVFERERMGGRECV